MAGSSAAAFDRYVSDHQAALVRYAVLLTGSRAQAEDLVQDVLIRLYPRWHELSDPHPYVRRSVTNEFLSWKRRWATRHIQLVDDDVLARQPAETTADSPDPELWARLTALPRQQRAAVVLRFYEGLTDTEIGAVLGCKPASVRGHVSRGLAALRADLSTPEGVSHDDR